jgi:hypothetical protein
VSEKVKDHTVKMYLYVRMKKWLCVFFGLNYISVQVPVLSALFFVLFLGNTATTSMVIPQKLQEQVRFKYQLVGLERLSWGSNKQHGTPRNQSSAMLVSIT